MLTHKTHNRLVKKVTEFYVCVKLCDILILF